MKTPNQKVVVFFLFGLMAYAVGATVKLTSLQSRVDALEKLQREMVQAHGALQEQLGDFQNPRARLLGEFRARP